jgi:hypothetical protein
LAFKFIAISGDLVKRRPVQGTDSQQTIRHSLVGGVLRFLVRSLYTLRARVSKSRPRNKHRSDCLAFSSKKFSFQRLEGEVKTAKIDCGEERFFCGKLSVNSYPTVFLYLDSDEKYEISSQDPTEIVSRVKQLVNDKHYEHDEL